MSLILDVRHPVPLRYVPKGARNPVDRFVCAASPVRLTEVARSDAAEVAHLEDGSVYHAIEGRLWVCRREHVTIRSLTEFLGKGGNGSPFTFFFNATPVRLSEDPAKSAWAQYARGEPYPESPRAVLDDGTAEAAAQLQAFLDRNVRVAGNRVLFRAEMGVVIDPEANTFYGVDHPHARWDRGLVAPMGRTEELIGFVREFYQGNLPVRVPKEFTRSYSRLPADLLTDGHDVGYMANHLALATESVLADAAAHRGRPGTLYEAIRAARSALAPFVAPARRGLVDGERFGEVLGIALQVADNPEMGCGGRLPLGSFQRLVRYAEAVVLPRAAPAIAAEDEDALSGLGPGRGLA